LEEEKKLGLEAKGKRAYFDIIASLLQALVEEPSAKTKLASRAKLDTRGTHRYITWLLKAGLVIIEEEDDDHHNNSNNNTNLIRVTQKGIEFLQEYNKLMMFLQTQPRVDMPFE
jgi:predicted transcriptional regulator